ncbi:hypothetical protein MPSEU_000253200 [Mayamaea pseudoterrestris]|nr:hypothetical protein MPSEU_000253200 [Mayamaea pseudoterrestris]
MNATIGNIAVEGDSEWSQFCSFAVTGAHQSLQAIYICRTCCTDETNVLCVCQGCADSCHAECEGLEYIGMGPSYCDCNSLSKGCDIQQSSLEEAARVMAGNANNSILQCTELNDDIASDSDNCQDFQCNLDAYCIPILKQNDDLHNKLCLEARELVQHSRETFWVDQYIAESSKHLCVLEEIAWAIYQRHAQNYNLKTNNSTICGAEWWVQVKPVSHPTADDDVSPHTDGAEAIDLHYDKDEVLAESFGLGLFPKLATVTYLTQSQGASPTVVLSRRYDQPDDDPISTMYLSHPRRGKHIVFDGSLLHGAPSHYALRKPSRDETTSATDIEYRITFLVNLWIGHHPAGVQPLDDRIRTHVMSHHETASISNPISFDNLAFAALLVAEHNVSALEDLDEAKRERIHLPFLSKGATWESRDDAELLVVSTFIPPQMQGEESTCLYKFDAGLEALVDSPLDDDEEANEHDYL